jgi:predicted nucleic acid-binding protein
VGRRLILDTNVLIASRGTIDRAALDDDELAIASVSVAEYRVGIELADTPERSAQHCCSCRQTGRTVVSRDANARFGDLPGVAAISA